MRKILFAFAFAVAMTLPTAARAALCPPAHTFTTGETLTNVILNLNPVSTSNCLANIDYTNIGTTGLKASNIKPIDSAGATFGGTQNYTFPANVSSVGNMSWGGVSIGGTLNASNGNINHTGDLNTGGNANVTGNVTAAKFVTGASQLDYNITNSGAWTFANPLYVNGFENIAGQLNIGGNIIGTARSQSNYQTQIGGTGSSYVVPYDANSTSGSNNTHLEHNSATTATFSGGFACTGTITFEHAYTATPDILLTQIGATLPSTTLYINSRTATTFQACAFNSGTSSGTLTISWMSLGE
jgi:hypothetical protein